jgi:5,10-methylenetetrahydromethanopterin reductase
MRRGVWVFPDAPAAVLLTAIRTAEELGLDEFWLGDEGVARDPFALLAAAAVQTSRIRLGIAVTNPYLRHPAATAAAAMSVHELAEGRFVLGLGPGGRIALGPVGLAQPRPLDTVRQALRTIRAVSHGIPDAGYQPPRDPFTRPALPVFVGSRSRRFQELASAEADGAFLGGVPGSLQGATIGWARSVRPIEIALYSTGVFDPDEAAALPPQMVLPLHDSPGHVLDALGLDRVAVAAARDALLAGNPGPARDLVTPEIFADLVLAGSPADVGRVLAERVRAHRPDSIGLTFTTPDPVQVVKDAAAAFEEIR